jgi:hypothetical protein
VTSKEPAISGSLVIQHRKILATVVGEDALARAFATLSASDRQALDEVTVLTYVPITAAEALFAAVGREVGRDVPSLHEQVSRTSLEQNLKTIWRLLLRFTSDEALIARTPVIFSKAFPQGQIRPRIVSPGRAEIRVEHWPDMPEYAIRGTRVAVETVLRLAGRSSVKLSTDRTSDGVVYGATWIP